MARKIYRDPALKTTGGEEQLLALREFFFRRSCAVCDVCPLGRSRQLDKSELVHDHDVSAMDLQLRKCSKLEDEAHAWQECEAGPFVSTEFPLWEPIPEDLPIIVYSVETRQLSFESSDLIKQNVDRY